MSQAVLAKYAKEGKDYLLVLSPSSIYKLTIKRISKTDDNTCNSVSVIDERHPGQIISISPETSLLEWDDELYNKIKKTRKNDTKVVINHKKVKQTKESTMPRTANPRSKVIDELLLKVQEGEKPDFQKIASDVVSALSLPEEDTKKVIAQARVRWYNLKKEKNPINS